MKKKANKNFGRCAYCSETADLTRDHIPPKSLFRKPLPDDLITVPCCLTCNNGRSKDDEYFRLALSLRYDVDRSHAKDAAELRIPMKSATHSDGSRPGIPIDVGHPLRGAPLGAG